MRKGLLDPTVFPARALGLFVFNSYGLGLAMCLSPYVHVGFLYQHLFVVLRMTSFVHPTPPRFTPTPTPAPFPSFFCWLYFHIAEVRGLLAETVLATLRELEELREQGEVELASFMGGEQARTARFRCVAHVYSWFWFGPELG